MSTPRTPAGGGAPGTGHPGTRRRPAPPAGPSPVGHYDLVCEHGTRHGGCRCPGPNKTTRRIPCPTPDQCRKDNGT